MAGRLLRILAALIAVFFLFGSGPMRDGTDVSGGAGYRRYERHARYGASCAGTQAEWRYREHIVDVATDVRRKAPDGKFVFAIEAGGAGKYVSSGTCTGDCSFFRSDVDKTGFGMNLATRFGAQWKYFGLMAGPGMFGGTFVPTAGTEGTPAWAVAFFPTVETWFGTRTFNFFLDLGANTSYHNLAPVKAGFGHADDEFKVSAGAGTGHVGVRGFVDMDKRLVDRWWLGASTDFQDSDNWAGMLRVTYEFDAPPKDTSSVSGPELPAPQWGVPPGPRPVYPAR